MIVIGAGIAGLLAARLLAEQNIPVLLLEASQRVGGRLYSEAIPGYEEPVELGAEFVHGRPTDLLGLLEEAGLERYELSGEQYCWEIGDFGKGSLQACGDGDDSSEIFRRLSLTPSEGRDISFAEFLAQQHVTEEKRQTATGYVEGFNAADASRISVQALAFQQRSEDEIEGDRLFHVKNGYSALAQFLLKSLKAAGGRMMLEHVVTHVQWRSGKVLVQAKTSGNEVVVRGERVIIAVPLGVLQARQLIVDPWPSAYDAISKMAMGPVHRISLVFKEAFWSRPSYGAGDMSFLFSQPSVPGVWWTSNPSKTAAPVLTGWIGGRRTQEIDANHLLEAALSSLTKIFGMTNEEIRAWLLSHPTHNWNEDPLTRGAYSYVCVGGVGASKTLSEPIEDTLFMAGEHTDITGHWGTVHGAMRSGVRAAEQVLKSLGK